MPDYKEQEIKLLALILSCKHAWEWDMSTGKRVCSRCKATRALVDELKAYEERLKNAR